MDSRGMDENAVSRIAFSNLFFSLTTNSDLNIQKTQILLNFSLCKVRRFLSYQKNLKCSPPLLAFIVSVLLLLREAHRITFISESGESGVIVKSVNQIKQLKYFCTYLFG